MTEQRLSTTAQTQWPGIEQKTRIAAPDSSIRTALHHYRRIVAWAVVDTLIIFAAYTAALSARAFLTQLDLIRGVGFTFFVVVIMLASLYLFGVYHRIWSRTSGHGVTVIVSAVVAATVVIGIMDVVMTSSRALPLSVVALGSALALSGFVAVRYRSRLVSGLAWRWRIIWHHEFPPTSARVLIVGAGESGQTIAWRLKHRSPKGEHYQIVGFVDDDLEKRGLYVEGTPVLGTRADIPRLVERKKVDLIVMAVHRVSGPDFREILSLCESTTARIKVVPDMFAILNAKNNAPLLREVQPEDFLGRQTVGRHEGVDLGPVVGKVILVTGAAGSIGAELCRQLLTYKPTALILLDNNESGLHDIVTELRTRYPQALVWPVLVDIAEQEDVDRVFREHKPHVVFHAAAYKHVPMLELYPEQAIRVNIGGTWNLARAACHCGAERFVLISTDKAVNPSNVMGASKRICEQLLKALSQQNGHPTLLTSVRFGNVLGSRGSVVPTFNQQIDNGGPVTVTHREMTRYFMSTSEAVNLVIHAACLTTGGDLFMLNMGEVVRIVEMAERMIRMRGLRPYEDIDIKIVGMRPGEKLHEELRSDAECEIPTVHPNIMRLVNKEDGFQPAAFLARLEQALGRPISPNHDAARLVFALAGVSAQADAWQDGRLSVAAD